MNINGSNGNSNVNSGGISLSGLGGQQPQPQQGVGQQSQQGFGQPQQGLGQQPQPGFGQAQQPGGFTQPQPAGGVSLQRPGAAPTGVGVSLTKGGNVSLTKGNPNLNAVTVGLGWDVNQFTGQDFDLDVQVFMLGENELVPSDKHFIFFNNPVSPDGSVRHNGDNRTGVGEGDDETISVQLQQIPPNVSKLVFTVTIYDAINRGQNFGQVSNSYIRVFDTNTQQELVRYDLREDFSGNLSVVVGELYRYNGEWKFRAVGGGYNQELFDFCVKYGVNASR